MYMNFMYTTNLRGIEAISFIYFKQSCHRSRGDVPSRLEFQEHTWPHIFSHLLTDDGAEGDDTVANGEQHLDSQGGLVDEGVVVAATAAAVRAHRGALGCVS